MLPQMLEALTAQGTGESQDDLRRIVEPIVWRLNGKDTLYQMIALAEQVTLRGGTPLDPRDYKQQFLVRLFAVSGLRIQQLRDHSCAPDRYLVPGTRALLEDLRTGTSSPAPAPCSKTCAPAASASTSPAAPTTP